MKLSSDDVKLLCEEIELQWIYLLMTRGVFHASFPNPDEYESPGFYQQHGISFHVRLPHVKSESFSKGAEGIAVWLNQNYIIRLFGILNSKGIAAYGKKNHIKLVVLIDILRNHIGAHSTGRGTSSLSQVKKATLLVNELFGRNDSVDDVQYFHLSVDSVLLPMKNQVIELVKSLAHH